MAFTDRDNADYLECVEVLAQRMTSRTFTPSGLETIERRAKALKTIMNKSPEAGGFA